MRATLLLGLLSNLALFAYATEQSGCPNRAFIGCILQLKEDHIQFDRNIVRVILGINSEAKLLHTCKSYTNVLPCFRDRVLECGNQQQKETFSELGRALMFLCSPFSLNRQRVLIRQHSCIAKVLSLPISTGCKLTHKPYAEKIDACKRYCATMPKNFTCLLKTWISEQNACTLNDISDQCGDEAADFYSNLQASIFDADYPFVCHKENHGQLEPNNFVTVSSAASIARTEVADLFSKNRLSTKTPYKSPMFYISHHTISGYQGSTSAPVAAITPRIVTAENPILRSGSNSSLVSSEKEASSNKTVSAAQATLVILLQKLLPLAFQANLTSFLSEPSDIMEFGKHIDFKALLENATFYHKGPQQNPITSNANYLTTIHVTPTAQTMQTSFTTESSPRGSKDVASITATSQDRPTIRQTPIVHNQRLPKTWKPWYFAVSSETDK